MRYLQGAQDSLGKYDGVARAREFRQKYDEFIASEATDRVSTTHALSQKARHRLQYPVTHCMSQRVIDQLEGI
jgi:hypothetical protein